jgi:uncharacterized lipoprotein YddW (UPF0748 family)
MRTGHREKSPITKALLAAAVIAVASTAAAYTFGPGAAAGEGGSGDKAQDKAIETGPPTQVTGATSTALKCDENPKYPKRQLRGVWIATVRNIDWPSRTGLTPARQQADYVKILDNAVRRGLNAVFVQVRPASDALYKSPYEPWSEYLTGTAGKDPGWDPLPFLVTEAHRRGLEFHAWFNPYRASYDAKVSSLPAGHPARQHPDWLVKHEGLVYYNPGLPAVRDHVTKVVTDVARRYDVDGIHFDDYFYPYPGKGTRFADQAAFRKYGKGEKLADWRRDNVNTLIAQVDRSVHDVKPYLKFGISPFGIWRNVAQDPSGSRTSGMSGYDEIYADARHWIKAGTVDYVIPQLYWPRGLDVADYSVLAPWWAKEVKGTGVDLYIGQALYRVGSTDTAAWTRPGELPAHLTLNRKHKQINGDVYFSASQLGSNPLRVFDRISAEHYSRPALLPLIKGLGGRAPAPPARLKSSGATLSWAASQGARGYAVYRVNGKPGECATADAKHMVGVVADGERFTAKVPGTYLVTALDRLDNESAPAQIAVKLP